MLVLYADARWVSRWTYRTHVHDTEEKIQIIKTLQLCPLPERIPALRSPLKKMKKISTWNWRKRERVSKTLIFFLCYTNSYITELNWRGDTRQGRNDYEIFFFPKIQITLRKSTNKTRGKNKRTNKPPTTNSLSKKSPLFRDSPTKTIRLSIVRNEIIVHNDTKFRVSVTQCRWHYQLDIHFPDLQLNTLYRWHIVWNHNIGVLPSD